MSKVIQCGLLSTVIQLSIFNFLVTYLHPTIANTIAVEIAILCGFITNNRYSFSSNRISFRQHPKIFFMKMLQFNCTSLISLLIQIGVMHFGVNYFGYGRFIYNALLILGILLGFSINIIFYRHLIWKKK